MPDFNLILRPLKKLGDVIKIVILEKIYPRDVPDRCKSIATVMNNADEQESISEESILALSQKLEIYLPNISDNLDIPSHITEDLLQKGLPCRHLMPHVKNCCGMKCKIILNNQVVVYEKNNILKGSAYKSVCKNKKCKSEYLLSTWKRKGGEWSYYDDCSKHEYFQSTRCSVFQREFLETIDRNM